MPRQKKKREQKKKNKSYQKSGESEINIDNNYTSKSPEEKGEKHKFKNKKQMKK